MKTFLKTAVITLSVALTGLTGMAVTAPAAKADTLEFRIGPGGVDMRERPRWGHHDRWDRDRRGRCHPGLAVEKARDYGFRRAQVVDVTPRRVVVEGRRFGDYRTISFANVRGCPVLGR
ncbi:hypothetical protein [Rhizobium sp. SG2393]|uniref:hypothetical protein n=1 Tax=Rhizobium sp. SG2393 TaxID=3276279 RepID=UPI00366CD175